MTALGLTYFRSRFYVFFTKTKASFSASLFIAASSLLLPHSLLADSNNTNAELEKQRIIYEKAQKSLKKRDYNEFDTLTQKLTDYPLYPYLRFEQLSRNLHQLKQTDFDAFIKLHHDTPLAWRLQIRWVRHLARQKDWKPFLHNFPQQTSSASLNCQHGWALLQTGKKSLAFKEAKELWLTPKSQPKTCNPLFEQWIKEGNVTEDIAWERFWMATLNSQSSLADYLTRFITTPEKKKLAHNAVRLIKNPALLETQPLSPSYERNSELIALLVKRLIRKNPQLSIKLWSKYNADLVLSGQQKASLKQRLGLYLLKSYHPDSETWLKQLDPTFADEKLLEWQLRFQLSQHDWDATGDLISKLPDYLKNENRWQYWKARHLLVIGNTSEAKSIFTSLSSKRSFYGFLSAQQLGLDYQLNNIAKPVNQNTLTMLQALPAMQRAQELFFHEDLSNARSEWWRVSQSFSKDQHYHAGLLAKRWGWISQGITGAISAKHWDDLELRFPAPYKQKITANANEFNIDKQWIYAIARQESAFKADVRSPAGALGLMQLMPRTAKQTAKNIKLSYKNSSQLSNPETNITLGSAYLAQMYVKHNGNRVYATAAYNAGPYRVSQWLKERGDLPIDIWVETIPYDETRRYVQNVLSYAVIYSEKLGLPLEFMTTEENKTLTGLTSR